MQNTNIVQGYFKSTGLPVTLSVPMGIDWMQVYDYTQYGTAAATYVAIGGATTQTALSWSYFNGMAAGTGLVTYKATGAVVSADSMTSGGFTVVSNPTVNSYDTVLNLGTPAVVLSTHMSMTTGTVTVTTESIASLVSYPIVRFTAVGSTGAALNGIDFSVDSISAGAGTFNLTNEYGLTGFTFAGTNGTLTGVNPEYYWYPTTLNIINMTDNGDGTSKIYTTVTSAYQTGQTIRFNIPKSTAAKWGVSTSLNGLSANVISVVAPVAATSAGYIVVDIAIAPYLTSASFNYPKTGGTITLASTGLQWCTLTPIGSISSQIIDPASGNFIATNKFTQAEFNQGYMGVVLGANGNTVEAYTGATLIEGPAGKSGDTMYWIAGKSFSVMNGINSVPPLPPLGF